MKYIGNGTLPKYGDGDSHGSADDVANGQGYRDGYGYDIDDLIPRYAYRSMYKYTGWPGPWQSDLPVEILAMAVSAGLCQNVLLESTRSMKG